MAGLVKLHCGNWARAERPEWAVRYRLRGNCKGLVELINRTAQHVGGVESDYVRCGSATLNICVAVLPEIF